MKYTLLLFLIICACNTNNKTPKPAINGTWEYKTIELYSGEKFDISDSMYNMLHQQHVGLKLIFSEGKTFSVYQKKSGKPEEFIARQDYELPGDTILRLKNTGRPDDEFPIIGISDSVLKVNLFKSPVGYVVFKKVE
jgi:hypothetical protein